MQNKENLNIVFKILCLKTDSTLLKEVCWFIAALLQFDSKNIIDHFLHEIKATIEPLKQQLIVDIQKLSTPNVVEDVKMVEEEEKINPFAADLPVQVKDRRISLVDDELIEA